MSGILHMGEHAYVVSTTTFDPYYSEFEDCLVWGLEVMCEHGALELRPSLNIDRLWTTSAGEPSDWTSAIGRIEKWDTRGQSAEAPALLYLWEHLPIEWANFEAAATNNRFALRFSGSCDLSYEETLTRDTLVRATLQPTTWGIRVSTTDEAYARRVLGAFVDLNEFQPERGDEGLRFVSRSYGSPPQPARRGT